MKRISSIIIVMIFMLSSCGLNQTDSKIVSYNLSKEADQFRIDRRIVFYNSWMDTYMLVIEGRCSIKIDSIDNQLEVTCKTGEEAYKKHFLGLSGQVSYFAEQLDSKNVSKYHYKVIFKPQSIIPDIDLEYGLDKKIK